MKEFLLIIVILGMIFCFSACDTPSFIEQLKKDDESAIVQEDKKEIGEQSTAKTTEKTALIHGQLTVGEDCKIYDRNQQVLQLKGISTYDIDSIDYEVKEGNNKNTEDFINLNTVKTLVEDWGAEVIKLPVCSIGKSTGYVREPEVFYTKVCDYIDLCVKYGVYVIVDWHVIYDGNPLKNMEIARDFFARLSDKYSDVPNIIYEICDEPNGYIDDECKDTVSWGNAVKPYAEEIIRTIRGNDLDNIILVGTPKFGFDFVDYIKNPIDTDLMSNVMLSFQYVVDSSDNFDNALTLFKQKVNNAIDNKIPLFCSKWVINGEKSLTDGAYNVNPEAIKKWIDFLKEKDVCWCFWSIGGTMDDVTNALNYKSDLLTIDQKKAGHWPDSFISQAGIIIRNHLLAGSSLHISDADN